MEIALLPDDGNYKFCRGCGENLKAISKAMERRWLKLFYRALDGYIVLGADDKRIGATGDERIFAAVQRH